MSPEPGWYRAVNDPPDVLRWWDGDGWSEHTHVLSDQHQPHVAAQPDAAPGPAAYSPSHQNPYDQNPSNDQTVMFPFQASQSDVRPQDPLSGPEAESTVLPSPPAVPYAPGSAAIATGQFQPGASVPFQAPGTSQPPTFGVPVGHGSGAVGPPSQWPAQAASAPYGPSGTGPPPPHTAAQKKKGKAGLIIGLIVGLCLLAGVVAVGIFALRGDDGESALDSARVDTVDVTTPSEAVSSETTTANSGSEESAPTTIDEAPTTTEVVVITDDLSYADAIDVSLADVQQFWTIRQPEVFGSAHEPVANIVAYKPSDPASYPSCGAPLPEEVVTGNAFYCPLNDTIAWDDEILLPALYEQFGDLAVSMVLVHEYGHAIQNRVDTEDQPTIVIELQADCFTGAWAGAVDRGESPTGLQLADGDLDEALAGYLTVRDPPGTDPLDPSAHGNGFDRLSAFLRGYRQDLESCADIDDNPPESSKLPPTPNDRVTGGNLALVDLLPLLEPDLDSVFAALVAQEGLVYQSPVRTPFDSRDGGVGGCPGVAVDAMNDLEAVACVDQNEIVWDLALADELFEIQGDIGATYPLIHAWAQLIVAQNGLAEGERAVELADCWAGAFLSVLFPIAGETKTIESKIRLSPGDLDEAIGTLLVYQPPLLNGASRYSGQAFARLAYLQDGVTEGPSACRS